MAVEVLEADDVDAEADFDDVLRRVDVEVEVEVEVDVEEATDTVDVVAYDEDGDDSFVLLAVLGFLAVEELDMDIDEDDTDEDFFFDDDDDDDVFDDDEQ